MVVGDFLAADLAEGLKAAFAKDPDIAILDRTSARSGLVRHLGFDWPRAVRALLAENRPDAVIMLVGANDRQSLNAGRRRETLRSQAWTREYADRAAQFASAVADTRTPLFWIGAPSFKSTKATGDMLAFNEVYRKAATDVGGQFVDIWDAFVDERGAFSGIGADISGQQVRLRGRDGVDFTQAGRRKLAFYVEKALRKKFDFKSRKDPSASAAGFSPPTNQRQQAPVADRTPSMSVTNPALDGSEELLGAGGSEGAPMAPPGVKGFSAPAVRGRADDFYERP